MRAFCKATASFFFKTNSEYTIVLPYANVFWIGFPQQLKQ